MNTMTDTQNVEDMIDPAYNGFDLYNNPVSIGVWNLKYRREGENTPADTLERVIGTILHDGMPAQTCKDIRTLIQRGIIIPAGRILAECGTQNSSTLMNCYVMDTIDDSIDGIMRALHESAKTACVGGGVGLNFSTIRPKGAEIKGAVTTAAGPVAFMEMWHAMGCALEAGGNRRGGKMAVLSDHHPDILEFIKCKQTPGRLTSFNISVAVSDSLIQAVKNDSPWVLYSDYARKEGGNGSGSGNLPPSIVTINGERKYCWKILRARDLWNEIMHSTYHYSEPGVLFIDRINELNNLYQIETIAATNPCGEEPLPPYGACNLGSINLAMLASSPFTADAAVNWNLLNKATRCLVRVLDTVLDITDYPLEAQSKEAISKRRIGIGITGLADLLALLDIPYNSSVAITLINKIMRTITETAYQESAELARTYGTFPVYYEGVQQSRFISKLSRATCDLIEQYGLRNSHLLSIAPAGTISAFTGDVSSGCEPFFAHKVKRTMLKQGELHGGARTEYTSYAFFLRLYEHIGSSAVDKVYTRMYRDGSLPPIAADLIPEDHLQVQAALQNWVDASISKTINVDTNIHYEELANVYMRAYDLGCKGCTTYRPSEVRGESVLSDATKTEQAAPTIKTKELIVRPAIAQHIPELGNGWKRPRQLNGVTYRFEWPAFMSPIYVTINHDQAQRPVELFIASKNDAMTEWSVAVSVLASNLLQMGLPPETLAEQLKHIKLSSMPAFIDGRQYGSLVSYVGYLLKHHHDYLSGTITPALTDSLAQTPIVKQAHASVLCSYCNSPNVIHESGCAKCLDCGTSKCG